MSLPLFWHASDNFGDALAPWLVTKLSGQTTHYVDAYSTDETPYVVTGSIFSHQLPRGIIWGAGCAYEADLEPAKIAGPSGHLRVVATRGPLSKEKVEAAGHKPLACGDPGLLVSRLYTPKEREPQSVGVICSWVDHAEVSARYSSLGIPVLNASTPVEEVLDVLASWDIVVSGCLHGLVAAVSFGKPVVWARFSHRLLGDDFKFRDFFATFDLEAQSVSCPRASRFEAHARRINWSHRELLDSCPFLSESATIL
ncbi:MAG: polysaccharide pyruvyl transferase family protein [Gammaproteobacteria bacterium]|nr:polysaccharide pyruvyl transferase family protein [Gammaproteobacteria bacterium]